MSKIKDWILRQQEIDSQDDPDMADLGGGGFADGRKLSSQALKSQDGRSLVEMARHYTSRTTENVKSAHPQVSLLQKKSGYKITQLSTILNEQRQNSKQGLG